MCKPVVPESLRVKKVFYNASTKTVAILWRDGDRTSVSCSEKDAFSVEEGLRAALAKRVYGHYHDYQRYIERAIDSEK
jgi:hypothetical protein